MESEFLKALPTGTALPAADQAAIKALSLAVADEPGKSALMKKRFNFDRIKEDKKDPGAGLFEPAVLDHMWELFERLPPQDVADNDWLEDITRKTGGSTPNGQTGGNRVAVGYASGAGNPESGAFTDAGDVMRGLNMFDANLIHEMGHASDNEHGWTTGRRAVRHGGCAGPVEARGTEVPPGPSVRTPADRRPRLDDLKSVA